jgi:hypothetical protein
MTEPDTNLGPQVFAVVMNRLAQHDMTPSAFAVRCGINPSILSRWKHGASPSLKLYLQVMTELDQMDHDKGEA